MKNTIMRSTPCHDCGAQMLWTQNAWRGEDGVTNAAYRCMNGHVLNPSSTRQCPACGVHDTAPLSSDSERQHFRCAHCGKSFTYPPS